MENLLNLIRLCDRDTYWLKRARCGLSARVAW